MEDPRKALREKLKTLSPEMLEAVGWLVEHWTVLKAIAAGARRWSGRPVKGTAGFRC